ncbi:MAG: hypothetical protein ICCCNLDF_02335 [Planctomycetes bacterium]|nr:hypothetical protein [Planctomycetota bacterium]
MSRFQKVRGFERNPRSRESVISSICSAQRIYLETGGEDIDFGIRSARATLKMYHEQCEGRPHPGVEPITHAQADRARAQLASFTRQRERKLEHIHAMVEEMYAHADQFSPEEGAQGSVERNADLRSAGTPVVDEDQPTGDDSLDSPERSAEGTSALPAGGDPATRTPADQTPAMGSDKKSALRAVLRTV